MITLSIGRGYSNEFSTQELDSLSTTIKAIVYARVSTQDQAKHGYSLESQVERSVALAKTKFGISDDQIIVVIELGEMGDDPNRLALNQALWLIEQGIGSKFIVLHPDRLSRDLKLQLYISERIWNAGCDLAFVEMDVDPNNPESMLLFNMQGAIAQYNKAKILANSRRGRRTKVRNGQIPGVRRVYGYTFDKEADVLIENSHEKETYLLMVDWILRGKDGQSMNLTSVARELSLLGIPAPNGDKWYQATVSRILKNPVYTGKFYYGKTESKQKAGKTQIVKKPQSDWQTVKVPAFIDDETFQRLQTQIDSLFRRNRGATPKTTYLLKGIVRCGRCGAAVIAGAPSRHKKTKEILYHYYVCSGKTRQVFEVGTGRQVHACFGRNWRKDVVDEYVWKYLVHCLHDPEETLKTIREQQNDNAHAEEMAQKRQRFQTALDEKQAERKRWLQLNAKGRISDEELDEELIPLDKDIEQLKTSVQLLSDSLLAASLDTEQFEHLKRNIEQFQDYIEGKISDEDKQKLVKLLVKRVVVHDGEIEIYTAWDFSKREQSAASNDTPRHTVYSNNSNAGQEHGGL